MLIITRKHFYPRLPLFCYIISGIFETLRFRAEDKDLCKHDT